MEEKAKKEYIYNLVIMQNHNLLDVMAFHKRKDAQTYMAIAGFYAQQQREKKGITDCELLIQSNNNIIIQWNGKVDTLTFDVVRSVLK